MYNCKFTVIGNNNIIEIGKDCELRNLDIWCSDGAVVLLKDKVHIVGFTHLAATEGKSITIGENCLLSNNIVIRTGDSHSIVDKDGSRINHAKSVVLGDHVWLGQGITILKGTVIGDNCIVGACSVLSNKTFCSNLLIAGNPGKTIKENVNWNPEV